MLRYDHGFSIIARHTAASGKCGLHRYSTSFLSSLSAEFNDQLPKEIADVRRRGKFGARGKGYTVNRHGFAF